MELGRRSSGKPRLRRRFYIGAHLGFRAGRRAGAGEFRSGDLAIRRAMIGIYSHSRTIGADSRGTAGSRFGALRKPYSKKPDMSSRLRPP